jgi:hypothetical protein
MSLIAEVTDEVKSKFKLLKLIGKNWLLNKKEAKLFDAIFQPHPRNYDKQIDQF